MRAWAAAAALLLAALCGCGGAAEGTPRERAARMTLEGSYQVRGIEDGKTRGVGVYRNGSFRIFPEDSSSMVIYDSESGQGWLVNLNARTHKSISRDEALLRAGFMPDIVMGPYFELEGYWQGEEFRMDTMDGRSIRATLEGPDFLPDAWLAESQGRPFKEIRWRYRRVGRVSDANFHPPEGTSAI